MYYLLSLYTRHLQGLCIYCGQTSWAPGFLPIHRQPLKRTRRMTRNRGDRKDDRWRDSRLCFFFFVVILHLLYNYKEHAMNWSFLFSHLDPFSYLISVLKSLAQVHHSHKSCWFFCSELNAHKMPLLTIVSFH